MAILGSLAITTAVTNSVIAPIPGLGRLGGVSLTAAFSYVASAATSAKAYVQTSLDDGVTWVDIACFAFTLASATKKGHISRQQVLAVAAITTGTLADDTLVQGFLGDRLRVVFTSVGTYGAGTTFAVYYQAG